MWWNLNFHSRMSHSELIICCCLSIFSCFCSRMISLATNGLPSTIGWTGKCPFESECKESAGRYWFLLNNLLESPGNLSLPSSSSSSKSWLSSNKWPTKFILGSVLRPLSFRSSAIHRRNVISIREHIREPVPHILRWSCNSFAFNLHNAIGNLCSERNMPFCSISYSFCTLFLALSRHCPESVVSATRNARRTKCVHAD